MLLLCDNDTLLDDMVIASSSYFMIEIAPIHSRIALQTNMRSALVVQIWSAWHHYALKDGENLTYAKVFDASVRILKEIGDLIKDPTSHVSPYFFDAQSDFKNIYREGMGIRCRLG